MLALVLEAMSAFLVSVDDRIDSAEGHLAEIGVGAAKMARTREFLVKPIARSLRHSREGRYASIAINPCM